MLTLNKDGAWFHNLDAVKHQRLEDLLHRSVSRSPEGALIVTTGRDVLPFSCEDTPRFVRALSWLDEHLEVSLLGGETLRLSALEQIPLEIDKQGIFRLRAEGFWHRVQRSATQWLWDRLQEDEAGNAYIVLDTSPAKSWAIQPSQEPNWAN